MLERTLMLIKPDGVRSKHIGHVIQRVETEGFRICGLKMLRLRRSTAGEFYRVHQGKDFYANLLDFMTSDRIVALALEREDAVSYLRKIVGDTDPAKAGEGTIRKKLASNIRENVVHASDSMSNAAQELSFFFSQEELFSIAE